MPSELFSKFQSSRRGLKKVRKSIGIGILSGKSAMFTKQKSKIAKHLLFFYFCLMVITIISRNFVHDFQSPPGRF